MDHPPLTQTNLFLRVAAIDDLFLKLASERGWNDYRSFFRLAQPHPEDLRGVESSERFENISATLTRFPAFIAVEAQDRDMAHYLLVHKLQYERLRNQTAVSIPEARFALLRRGRLWPRSHLEPALFQQRIFGVTLWDMFDFDAVRVKPAWRPHLPAITVQLSRFLDSGLLAHVDWNIQNFVFHTAQQQLFYVDLKPSVFVAKSSNEHNLKGIRDYFLV